MKKLLALLLALPLFHGVAHAQWAQFPNSTAFFSTPTTIGGVPPGTAGQAYTSNGPLLPPSFGTLSCLGGGTGLTAAPAAGSILIGTGKCWQIGTIQGGTNVTITNTGGVITISSTGGGGGSVTFETNGLANANQAIFNLENSAATNGLILTAVNTSGGNVQLGFTGALTNAGLANSSITLGSTNVALGATATTLAGFSSISSTSFTGALTGNASTATTASGLSGLAANTIICNPTGSIASSQTCTLGTNLSFSGNVINATAGAGGVASITGDGALITNSASTGGVTLTLGNTGVGYGVWGNIGSSSGAPGYHALSSYPTAAFPTLNQNTTGTAANVTATSNATLATLSALSLPYSQLTGAPASLPASSVTVGTTTVASGTTDYVLYDNGGTLGNTNAPAISGVNLTALPTNTALYPTLNQSTSGNAATATAATNLAGGTANQIPYQTAASTTAFFSAADYGVQIYGSSGVPSALAGAAGVLQGSASAIPAWTTAPTLTGANFSAIPNGALTNSSVTIGSTNVALGATTTTLAGLSSVTATTFTGALTGNASTATTATNLAGGSANQLPYQTAAGATSFETTVTAAQSAAISGDVTKAAGSASATVTKVNNGAIPVSAACAGTNSSGQFNSCSTTGSGSTVVLATSPTLVTPNIDAATGTSLSVSGQLTSTVATGTAPLVVSSTTQVANLNAASVGGFTLPCTVPSIASASGEYLTNNGSTCSWGTPAGSGTVNTALQYSLPYYSASGTANTLSGLNSPTSGAGYYTLRFDPTSTTAVAPTADQVGAIVRSISGATSTDTALYSDVLGVVLHDKAGSAAVTETLPTPTTLVNAHFAYNYCNDSANTDTITPTTWTIALNGGSAGASISVGTGVCATVTVDPFNASQWDAFTYGAGGSGAQLNVAQTWSAAQTFPSSDILVKGTSTGTTAVASANASSTNYTATLPANTGTIGELNLAQTWTAAQTYGSSTTFNYAPGASSSEIYANTNPYSGGSGSTTQPLWYFTTGATAPTTWSTGGTYIGWNAASTFTGNWLDFHVNGGASVFSINYQGNVTGGTYNGTTIPSSATLLTSGGALGTPSSGVATNLTGTASGLSIGGNAATATQLAASWLNTASSGTSVTPICATGQRQTVTTVTATGNLTINLPTGCGEGQSVILKVTYTASITYTWVSGYHANASGPGAIPTSSGGSSGVDFFTFYDDAANSRFDYLAGAQAF